MPEYKIMLDAGHGGGRKGKKEEKYQVKRIFLGKISVEELIVGMVRERGR